MFQKGLIPLALIAFAGAASATQTAPQPAPQPAAQGPAATTATPATVAVRDWSRVDTNRDHLVSPEEMEKYLADNPGPLKKTS